MKTVAVLALAVPLWAPAIAEAGREPGGGSGGGGGGRLGSVSSGMGSASRGGGGGGSSAPSTTRGGSGNLDNNDGYVDDPTIVLAGGLPDALPGPPQPSRTRVDGYVGAQKVHESDGSFSAELSFNEGRFRFGGTLTRYYEEQASGDNLSLTLPALFVGARIDDGGPTRVYLEVGAAWASTNNDPRMDTSVSGFLGGARLEHKLSRRCAMVASAHAMIFEDDIKARQLRAGVRLGPVVASLRYFDMSVGPALYGPELGLAF